MPICLEGSVRWFNSAMFASAVVANTFNWIYQTLRITKFHTGIRRNQMGFHIGFASVITLEILVYVGLVLTSCYLADDLPALFPVFGSLYAGTFLFVGIIFSIVGINFYKKFKTYSPENAKKQKCRIFASILIIFTCFMIRGINIIFTIIFDDSKNEMALNWIDGNSIVSIILLGVYYFIVDVIPSMYLSFSIWMVTEQYKKKMEPLTSTMKSTEDRLDLNL